MAARRILWGISGALVALAIGAAPAAATSVQDQTGQPYTGPYSGVLAGSAVVTSASGSITCSESAPAGQIINPGTSSTAAVASLTTIDFKTATQACPDTFALADHLDFQALDLAWPAAIAWLNDNTSGARNATFTLSNVSFRAYFVNILMMLHTCDYGGNFGGTSGTSKLAQADLYNPNNSPSGNTELRFVNAPITELSSDLYCDDTATLTAKYFLTGSGGTKLQFHQSLPGTPPSDGGGSSGGSSSGTAGASAGTAPPTKCKKGKHHRSATAAKKKCKKKK